MAVDVNISWRAFQPRGRANPHGWGYAYVDDGRLKGERFASPLDQDHRGDVLLEPGSATTLQFLGHVRYKVTGKVAILNTQPFLNASRDLAFAATMSASGINRRFRKEVAADLRGRTGPEVLFALLGRTQQDQPLNIRLEALLRRTFAPADIGPDASCSLCVMNKDEMYVFAHRRRVWALTRRPPHQATVSFRDRKHRMFRAELRLAKNETETATIIASAALTQEPWQQLPDRTLVAIKRGEIAGMVSL